MKQYLVKLEWYEYKVLGIIKANTRIKALENLLLGILEKDKASSEYNVGLDIPLFSYEYGENNRHQIAKYLKEQVIPRNVAFICLEINSNTNAYLGRELKNMRYQDVLITLP